MDRTEKTGLRKGSITVAKILLCAMLLLNMFLKQNHIVPDLCSSGTRLARTEPEARQVAAKQTDEV